MLGAMTAGLVDIHFHGQGGFDVMSEDPEEVLGLSAHGDANAALDRLIETGRKKLDALMKLPEDLGRDFEKKVRARAKT